MSDPTHRFFLQAIDLDYGCPVLEAMFSVANLDDLRAVLGPCAADDPELERWYSLDRNDRARIRERFSVEFEPGDRSVYLQGWDRFRGISLSGARRIRTVPAAVRHKENRAL
jgi:hypothetical protein